MTNKPAFDRICRVDGYRRDSQGGEECEIGMVSDLPGGYSRPPTSVGHCMWKKEGSYGKNQSNPEKAA